MKSSTIFLLIASLALNVVLAGLAVIGSKRLAAELAAQAAAATAHQSARPVATTAIDPQTWAGLQTPDLAALTQRLRETGFPKDIIRAIIRALVSEQFSARQRALANDDGTGAFWKDASSDLKVQLAQFRLSLEQETILRDLLGADARASDPLTQARQRARFGPLSPEKMDAVQVLVSDFDRKRSELYYEKGSLNQEDSKQIESTLRAALAGILSPAELVEYDLRNSNTGRTLRTELAAFNPTEEEFRAIFRLRQPFDEQYGGSRISLSPPDVLRQRSEAQKELNAQIATLFGPDRAAEYTRSIDSNYRQTDQLVARYELPPATTVNLWNTKQEFERRRTEIYSAGSGLTQEQRTQQLTALQQEAIARVTPLLGNSNRLTAYKQYGGSWIDSLVPRPRPAP